MYKIGLTGGIASGKSTVLNWFKNHGIAYVDADVVARDIVEPGKPALDELKKAFGPSVILPDGTLNRRALGDIVFQDKDKLAILNSIFKKYLSQAFQEAADRFEKAGAKACIFDVPLLIEHDYYKDMDEVWLVYVDPKSQLERLMARNNFDESQAKARIGAQMNLDDKKAYAQEIIDNSGDQEALDKTLASFWDKKKHLFSR